MKAPSSAIWPLLRMCCTDRPSHTLKGSPSHSATPTAVMPSLLCETGMLDAPLARKGPATAVSAATQRAS